MSTPLRRRATRRRVRLLAGAAAVVLLVSCTTATEPTVETTTDPTVETTTDPTIETTTSTAAGPGSVADSQPESEPVATADTVAAPPVADPFAGLTWSGDPAPVNAFLHDDGTTLWSVALDGSRTVVWEHPPVDPLPLGLQAAPDGTSIAMAISLHAATEADVSSILYLLKADGSIDIVDVARGFVTHGSPIFIRPPTDPEMEPQLYWIRFLGEIDDNGRLKTHVMTLTPDGPAEVATALRYHEAVFALDSYPGAATFIITLFRHGDVPTRLELLQNIDFYGAGVSSRLSWSDNEPRINTDVFTGVAWANPNRYIVSAFDESVDDTVRLIRFEMGCEWYGGEVVYESSEIGRGLAEAVWELIAPDERRVLALTRDDELAIANGAASTAPWVAIDLETGVITPTGAEWEPGPWAWVNAADRSNPPLDRPDCS
jgi:hypothetical protein